MAAYNIDAPENIQRFLQAAGVQKSPTKPTNSSSVPATRGSDAIDHVRNDEPDMYTMGIHVTEKGNEASLSPDLYLSGISVNRSLDTPPAENTNTTKLNAIPQGKSAQVEEDVRVRDFAGTSR